MLVRADFHTVFAYLEKAVPILDVDVRSDDFPCVADSPYREGYDWLYVAEQYAMQSLRFKLKALRFALIGDTGVLSEALSNAFCHGHKKRPDLPITIQAFLGKKGLLISTIDQGPDFAVWDVFSRIAQGRHYCQLAGNGMIRLRNSANFKIFYDQEGRPCNIRHLFKEDAWQTVFFDIFKENKLFSENRGC